MTLILHTPAVTTGPHTPSTLLAIYDAKNAPSRSETQPLLADLISGEKAQELLLCSVSDIRPSFSYIYF
jgi:hypothetical protein